MAIPFSFQVNIPFNMLVDTYLDHFMRFGLNPEIGLSADVLDGYSLSEFQRIADMFHKKEASITFHGPFMDLSPGSSDQLIREVTIKRFEQMIQLIPIFNPITIVCHAGYDHSRYQFMKDEWQEKALAVWKTVSQEISNNGSRLMLENVYESNPDTISFLMKNLTQFNVGVCFDIGHQAVFGQLPLASWLEELSPYIGQFHLHDNLGNQDSHFPLGKGSIPLHSIFKWILQQKKIPVMTLEPHTENDLWTSIEYLNNYRW